MFPDTIPSMFHSAYLPTQLNIGCGDLNPGFMALESCSRRELSRNPGPRRGERDEESAYLGPVASWYFSVEIICIVLICIYHLINGPEARNGYGQERPQGDIG